MSDQLPTFKSWLIALLVAGAGVTWQFWSLSLIEQSVTDFPSVHDILLESLPQVDFGIFGEIWFFGLIVVFAVPHFRHHWRATPSVLMALGLMYFVRGWFLYLLPIGPPYSAVDPALRLEIWGHASHAFFPGGHIAILTVLAMMTLSTWVRRILWIGLIIFGVGTLLAKTHYTMDSIGGILLGYASVTLVQTWTRARVRR